ncbi:hypothetical protein BBP40_003355 [Aspergillus hancockii]|nr:hypothetical protein BBP40_003355 [Aspergillus hancockii]
MFHKNNAKDFLNPSYHHGLSVLNATTIIVFIQACLAAGNVTSPELPAVSELVIQSRSSLLAPILMAVSLAVNDTGAVNDGTPSPVSCAMDIVDIGNPEIGALSKADALRILDEGDIAVGGTQWLCTRMGLRVDDVHASAVAS